MTTATRTEVLEFCEKYGACSEGREWAQQYNTMAEAWDNCKNPDWMLWILDKLDGDKSDPRYRLLACRFIRETPLADGRRVWDLLTDKRSRNAVVVAERYVRGEATDEELAAARIAARDAAGAAAGVAAVVAAGVGILVYGRKQLFRSGKDRHRA